MLPLVPTQQSNVVYMRLSHDMYYTSHSNIITTELGRESGVVCAYPPGVV